MTDETGGWGVTFHRHFLSNEIHRDGTDQCNHKGRKMVVYVFDPEYLEEHDRFIAEDIERKIRALPDVHAGDGYGYDDGRDEAADIALNWKREKES